MQLKNLASLTALAILATLGATAPGAHAAANDIVINEIESNGGTPGDWVELYNQSDARVDLSGYTFRDSDDKASHFYTIPEGTTIESKGYYVLEEADFDYGLGDPDSARLWDAGGAPVDSYTWSSHATVTYQRCPNGTGEWTQSVKETKGAANLCTPVVVNEVATGDSGFVELFNTVDVDVDLSGHQLAGYTLPAGTTIPASGYLAFDAATLGVTLGDSGDVSLVSPDSLTVDTYSWTTAPTGSWSRCPDGDGDFADSATTTEGAPNTCTAGSTPSPWPGGTTTTPVDSPDVFTGDMSGLDFGSADVLWAVQNGDGLLYRLVPGADGGWVPDAGWESGRAVQYVDTPGGIPDAEGVTATADSLVFVGTERNNADKSVSLMKVIAVDPSGEALRTLGEWDLTPLLPTVGANSGIEAIEWIPDADAAGLFGYAPDAYGAHYGGLFLIGIEGTGNVHAVVLEEDGTATVIGQQQSGFPGVMALDYDADLESLWVLCDDVCGEQVRTFDLADSLTETAWYARPADTVLVANEGFAIAPLSTCADRKRPVYWADDSDTDGNSLRQGWITCTAASEDATTPTVQAPADRPTKLPQTGQDGTMLLAAAVIGLLGVAGALVRWAQS